jgi:hypothetical protein
MDHPTFCRIEYWNEMTASWEVGHAGVNLINPALYVKKLGARGTIARAVDRDGNVVYSEGADLL